ncbi:helix-turn-helix domain-containing protein [Streptomyces violascens]|uniref:helix-turn-helix domain-containing protein n=1 Tax=Streptomyces violascens TaxID=67381 RepID=UPI0036801D6F
MSDSAQAAPPAVERMLGAAEVAEALNLSLTAVYRLARSGELRSHRHGQGKVRPRGLRIPQSAVDEHLRRSQLSTGDRAPGALRIPESVLKSTDSPSEEVA